ncbi:TonB-dependent receptor [Terriglobus roseus]|uniref:Carboxypeptidase regulatory-like domain-containing protein n=1 Tax=Terriglobus roseus TaxID=392734 RepID=A0A1G7H048_9BACT|nr:carboxypeptidase-like regulatory domain-containing protein [Terriglobus roseus]SDE93704.1 Carboxypeptidase regulatory-like domain-containing protein [Terriglobus roseus]
MNNFRSHKTALSLLALAAVSMLYTAGAQLVRGTIAGTVTDSAGSRIAGAKVHITNQSTGIGQELITSDNGSYTSSPLEAGHYKVEVSKDGFSTLVSGDIVLDAAAHVTQDAALAVGAATETVTVSALPPALNTTDATIGNTIDSRASQQLPVNGRSALALATLVPGVVSNLGAVSEGFANRGTSVSAIRISGGVTGQNSNLLDGINNVNSHTSEIGVNVKSDAIQEFRIMTGVIPAQFGYTSGGVINVVTRSGGNQFHGSLYEFFRNDALDANIAFPRSPFGKPKVRFNNYGGTVGGPIIKQKLFFFTNLEAYHYISETPAYTTVPTAQEYNGDFSDLGVRNSSGACTTVPIYNPSTATTTGSRTQYPGNKITNLDPVAVAFSKMFYPQANNTSGTYDPCTHANNYINRPQGVSTEKLILGRLDYQMSDRDNIVARYALYDNTGNNPGGYSAYFNRNDESQTQNALLTETHVFSSNLINEARIGIIRNGFPFQSATAGQNISNKIGLPDPTPLIGPVMSNGLATFNTTYGFRTNTGLDLVDDVTLIRGNHVFHLGASFRWTEAFNYQLNGGDSFSFSATQTAAGNNTTTTTGTGSAFASFLAGAVATASDNSAAGIAMRKINYAGYVQDDWKAGRRLTINAGLRYDFGPQAKEKKNGLSNVDITKPNGSNSALMGLVEYAGHGYGTNFANENFNDWGPRLGFVLLLTNDNKTVLRGGAAIYYTPNAGLDYTEAAGNINGFASQATSYSAATKAGPAFQLSGGLPYAPNQVLGAAGGQTAFLGNAVYVVQPAAKDPSSQQYTLSVSRELPFDTVLEATYLGNAGRHFPYSYTINQNTLDPKYFSLGTSYLNTSVSNPYAGMVPGSLGASTITRANLLKPFPYYSGVYQSYARTQSYNGNFLYVTATRRATNGLQIIGSYTYGKLMDVPIFDLLLNSPGAGTNSVNGPQNWRDPSGDYSVDVQDVTHRVTVSGLYDLPFGKGKKFLSSGGPLNYLVGGWQFNTIFTFEGGRPLVISGANNQGIATRPNLLPGAKVKMDHPTTSKWFNTAAFVNPADYTFGNTPRAYSHARGPSQTNFDMSIFKTTPITHGARLEFRIEAYNVLNHTQLGQPNTTFVAGPAADPSNPTAEGGTNTSATFGTITSALSARIVQLGAKILF